MLERMKSIFTQYVAVDPDEITGQSDLRLDLGLNSLELTHLVSVLEEEFGVEISDRDILSFKVVDDVIKFIENNKSM